MSVFCDSKPFFILATHHYNDKPLQIAFIFDLRRCYIALIHLYSFYLLCLKTLLNEFSACFIFVCLFVGSGEKKFYSMDQKKPL